MLSQPNLLVMPNLYWIVFSSFIGIVILSSFDSLNILN